MKIYTRTGDGGRTSLFSGERVSKADPRLEVCGEIDELNAVLGALAAALPATMADQAEVVRGAQGALFAAGAHWATAPGSPRAEALKDLGGEEAARLEAEIDRLAASLPPLERFILPGGSAPGAWAHVARTVCRRAERRAVALLAETADPPPAYEQTVVFLNRLSDFLFVLARAANREASAAETEWEP
ncbi:MAG: cob(I)yrinic acid a,c-diamide adenosyltransferase [Candidatus Eisenbacteria bacterium]|uniref:Corrinoid adenosyltransferase n=1 Tax=Eiseniibacteriota bacterium TaxID=2212470 RepID=A0A938BQJ7_UNCEI|nr:cob(I)yrinic acid a,c-diamide adenosyltransferase [Candidatus Eisenbacteria bacterium]